MKVWEDCILLIFIGRKKGKKDKNNLLTLGVIRHYLSPLPITMFDLRKEIEHKLEKVL